MNLTVVGHSGLPQGTNFVDKLCDTLFDDAGVRVENLFEVLIYILLSLLGVLNAHDLPRQDHGNFVDELSYLREVLGKILLEDFHNQT